ncbi:hypothetical protein PGT21_025918 [Puccinia graminis f. sp. tritici]|uniref:Uncharacterized protein n=1 Tax=Puccinia graminis f. sp. tritici TaxID=56615 RepID=A0A5B0PAB6_PUCGR|nr:hypothetical protein PGT21_025918 [Puccinia graminis f. sp. tritici]KAA1117056.1 hypothetical protein PGTUg99_034856 [Puccinia graminis f. sp. tritici]
MSDSVPSSPSHPTHSQIKPCICTQRRTSPTPLANSPNSPKKQKMVAFAHLITLLSVLVAMSRADEVAQAKPEQVDDKWYYGRFRSAGYWGLSGMSLYSTYPSLYTNYYSLLNSYCYGLGTFPYSYNLINGYFAKATDAEKSVSRRAISLDAEQLVRRDTADSFTCTTHGAAPQTFSAKECVAAAQQLSEKKVSTASHGGCKVALANAKEKFAPGHISSKDLETAVRSILSGCSNAENKEVSNNKPEKNIDEKQVVMLITKA